MGPMDIPLYPPPPGQTSNFVNPESQAPLAMAICGTAIGLAWIFYLLRMYSKLFVVKTLWWDDATITLGMIGMTGTAASLMWAISYIGPHAWNIRLLSIPLSYAKVSMQAITISYGPTSFLIKLSLLLLFLRLFRPELWMRVAVWIGAISLFMVYFAHLVAGRVLCWPRGSENWFLSVISERCIEGLVPVNLLAGSYNVVIDVYIFILPWPALRKLNMPSSRKHGVMMIFATGALAVICSIVSLYYRVSFTYSVRANDPTWNLPMLYMTLIVEGCIGIMCACMPYLPALFRKYRITSLLTSFRRSFSRHHGNHTGSSGSNSRWKKVRSPDTESLEDDRHRSIPMRDARARIDTQVLGTIDDGKFMTTTAINEVMHNDKHRGSSNSNTNTNTNTNSANGSTHDTTRAKEPRDERFRRYPVPTTIDDEEQSQILAHSPRTSRSNSDLDQHVEHGVGVAVSTDASVNAASIHTTNRSGHGL